MVKKIRTVSVAMAVYNGETYLKEQIDSIMSQLKVNDELVVSLDPSKDASEEIIKSYMNSDSRVKLYYGKGKGAISNFENAIRHCRNSIIFLADQDDVWQPDKVRRVLAEFENPKAMVVLHNAQVVDEDLNILENSFFSIKNSRKGILRNIIKNSYMGCCMAFRRKCLKNILPFPPILPMHDQWIGLCCEWMGEAVFMEDTLLLYRRHGNNVSEMQHASAAQMLKWRIYIVYAFLSRNIFKIRKENRR